MSVFQRVHMPSLDGATGWLNSGPLGPAELRGHVVLVNFWTLTCINWLRQEPYVRAWSQAYRDDGLVVIGVHTPEFTFEHETEGVRQAVGERDIDYPVATDNDYGVWTAFANHYWPALYFVDREGIIRDQHFGEGRYEESERVIQRLLGSERELVSVEGVGVEVAADWDNLGTPETYLGSERGDRRAYSPPERLPLNQWAVSGEWTTGAEKVVLEDAGGSIAFRFHARDAHLVLSPRGERADSPPRATRRRSPRRVARRGRRRGGERAASRGAHVPAGARARHGARTHARDLLPGTGRRGLRVHVRVAEMDDWVVVDVARSEPEAELLCSVLRGSGIECLPRLTDSGAGAGDGLGTVGAHEILGSPQDAQDARVILREPRGE